MNTTTVTTTTTVDRHGKPQVSVRAEIPHDLVAARAAEVEAMRDLDNWHPLLGSRYWTLTDEAIDDAIKEDGAEITSEVALRGAQRIVAGNLGKSRGYQSYIAILDEQDDIAARRHLMFCPGMED